MQVRYRTAPTALLTDYGSTHQPLGTVGTTARGTRLHGLGEAHFTLTAQDVLEQLPRRVAGQVLGREVDVRGHLELGQLLGHPLLRLLLAQRCTGLEPHHRLHLFTERRM